MSIVLEPIFILQPLLEKKPSFLVMWIFSLIMSRRIITIFGIWVPYIYMSVRHDLCDLNGQPHFMNQGSRLKLHGEVSFLHTISSRSTICGVLNDCKGFISVWQILIDLDIIFMVHWSIFNFLCFCLFFKYSSIDRLYLVWYECKV